MASVKGENMKEKLKLQKKKEQKNQSYISGSVLPDDLSLIDTHRKIPRMKGGKYTKENYGIILPIEHLKEHDNYKERPEFLAELDSIIDAYSQCMKLRIKINNQFKAVERQTDQLQKEDIESLKNMLTTSEEMEDRKRKELHLWFKKSKEYPENTQRIIKALLSVVALGEVTAGYILSDINPKGSEKHPADHPSCFWAYAGFHKASHERKQKNELKKDGSQRLRTALYVFGTCIEKNRKSPYRLIYDNRKKKTQHSEILTHTRITGKKGIHEMMWKDVSDGHRRGDAIRVALKHFLADLWFVWRTIESLPITDLYVKEHLGHQSAILNPKERGWDF